MSSTLKDQILDQQATIAEEKLAELIRKHFENRIEMLKDVEANFIREPNNNFFREACFDEACKKLGLISLSDVFLDLEIPEPEGGKDLTYAQS